MKWFLSLIIFIVMSSSVVMAEEIPEDWQEYQSLPASVLCGYVEIKLHEDKRELVYLLSLAADKLSNEEASPAKEQSELIQKAWHLTLQVAAIYNDESPGNNEKKQQDLAKLRASQAKLRQEAEKRSIVLEEAFGLDGRPLEPPHTQPKRNLERGEPITDPNSAAKFRGILSGFIKMMEAGDKRGCIAYFVQDKLSDADPRWERFEKIFNEKKEIYRSRIQFVLDHELNWRLEKNGCFNCVIGVDEKGSLIALSIACRGKSIDDYIFTFYVP